MTEQVVKKEAFADSPQTVQVEQKQGSLKHKKKISHKEVITESLQTKQVEEKQGSLKHKKKILSHY